LKLRFRLKEAIKGGWGKSHLAPKW